VVARIAAEHDVDLSQVTGTGREGRITKKDMLAYVAASKKPIAEGDAEAGIAAAPVPQPAVASPLADTLVPHSTMRRTIAAHMVRSKQTSPHVTTVFEVDFSNVVDHRRSHREAFARDGANLTFTPYLVFAVVQALKAHPQVNSEWREDGLLLHREINIGMATAVAGGLIVPVIKHADSYNLLGLTRDVNDLATRARLKGLTPEDVQGGTFSLTNHGTTGSLFATPIINQLQCGILGVGVIEKRVKVIDDAIVIRFLAYASFTFDHRILDGASADHFVGRFKQVIETWR
jgi:2-oxoglutarate dehydrogenase E2 component (dihydrolipoamide succinyltransferase)